MISRLASGLTRHPALAGAGLSLLSLPVHLVLPEAVSIPFAAVILGLVAGIYVGFALQDGRRRILATEGLAAVAFLAFALAGLTWSPGVHPDRLCTARGVGSSPPSPDHHGHAVLVPAHVCGL